MLVCVCAFSQKADEAELSDIEKGYKEAVARGNKVLENLGEPDEKMLASEYLEMRLAGVKNGYSRKSFEKIEHEGKPAYKMTLESVMRLPDGITVKTNFTAVFDKHLGGISFSLTSEKKMGKQTASKHVEGKRKDNAITFMAKTRGGNAPATSTTSSVEVEGRVPFANFEILLLRAIDTSKKGLYCFKMFDPETAAMRYHIVECLGKGKVLYLSPAVPPIQIVTDKDSSWKHASIMGGMIMMLPIKKEELKKDFPPKTEDLIKAIRKHAEMNAPAT